MRIKEVTSLVEWGETEGEDMPLVRCICGTQWKAWQGPVLSIYQDDPAECEECGRKYIWIQRSEVYEIT